MSIKCKRCNRVLTNPKSIELGYGRKCYRIIQLQEPEPEPEQVNNTVLEELLNRIRKVELDNNFMKHQLKHRTIVSKHPDEELDWDIKPEIKQIKNEYKIEFNVVVKELKVIFNGNKPILKNDRFTDEELGIKDIEIVPENIDYCNILKPIDPIEEPVSPPIMAQI